MKLASIERVLSVEPIPGADRVESARVLGYSTVVKKGEFKPGDLCIWHNPDTVVNVDNPAYAFMSKTKGRLKTIRLRGVVSQGLALPLSTFGEMDTLAGMPEAEGYDVTTTVGIKKYEKPEPGVGGGNLRGTSRPSNWPSFLQKTDETNIQSYPALLADFLVNEGLCELVKKYDGSSATFYDYGDEQGVCSRNQKLDDGTSIWWQVAHKYGVLDKIKGMNIAIQGEIVGPGVQQNPLNRAELTLYVFDIFDIESGQYWSRFQVESFCAGAGLPVAEKVASVNLREYLSLLDETGKYPVRMPEALEMLLTLADKTEYAPGIPCEGLVLRPVVPAQSRHGSRNRLSAKVMSRVYDEA